MEKKIGGQGFTVHSHFRGKIKKKIFRKKIKKNDQGQNRKKI